MTKVFINGSAGTTGLRIAQRLAERADIELVSLPESLRKDPEAVKEAIWSSSIAFFCLPDQAAVEAAELAQGSDTVILDTSTAHRTAPGWVYGFPELGPGQSELIKGSRRIAVPGCHASGFIALVTPLVQAGLIDKSACLSSFSLTGYSGGGKSMIAQYEAPARDSLLEAPRQYGLSQQHKHLREMQHVSGMENAPCFCPIVGDFYSGMEFTVCLFASQLRGGAGPEDIKELYRKKYPGPIVSYREAAGENGFLSAGALSGKDSMELSVLGNDERILLTARYDNLGKGASGAAIECMNIVMGLAPETGLEI